MSGDPGIAQAKKRGERVEESAAEPLNSAGGGRIWVGTASWTDPTITAPGVFYPLSAKSAEARLRYYASKFSVVEVDSTYYALPARKTAELWLERTPPGFMFNVKAHALMTGQPTEVKRLPDDIRRSLPANLAKRPRIYGNELPGEILDEAWRIFRDALAPLHEAGKIGSILLQFPRWFLPGRQSMQIILDAHARLGELRGAVELRNRLWFSPANSERTLLLLEENRIPFVMVDEPQGTDSSIPPIMAVTSTELAIVRFHGRRLETWEAPNVTAVERFRYLYDPDELAEWVPRIQAAAGIAKDVHAIMNNCYGNYGTTNARELAELLRDEGRGMRRDEEG